MPTRTFSWAPHTVSLPRTPRRSKDADSAGFGAARRAYDEHERVLALDPTRKDAGMVVGMYRYGVSTLSWPWRLVAGMAGFGGGKDRGLRMVEDAAAFEATCRRMRSSR